MMTATLTDSTIVTQSKFFVSNFNTAIIDGPLRIYFAEEQEALALKLYFRIQELFERDGTSLQNWPEAESSVFCMVYPTEEIFQSIFEAPQETNFHLDRLGKDFVFGLTGATDDQQALRIYSHMRGLVG